MISRHSFQFPSISCRKHQAVTEILRKIFKNSCLPLTLTSKCCFQKKIQSVSLAQNLQRSICRQKFGLIYGVSSISKNSRKYVLLFPKNGCTKLEIQNWTPANLENVNSLRIFVDYVPKNVKMMHIGQVLINVEELYIMGKKGMLDVEFDSEFISRLRNFLLGFKKLTTVRIVVPVDITDFLDFLQAIANLKDVKFSLNICIVHDHLERKHVRGVFEEGFKIVKNTFPNESTELRIGDVQYEYIEIEKKYNKNPKINTRNLDDVRGRTMKNQPKMIPVLKNLDDLRGRTMKNQPKMIPVLKN